MAAAISALGGLQPDGQRVDAVPVAGGGLRGVVEDVPEVAVAGAAEHLGPHHAVAAILAQDDVVGGARLPERRPAAVRVELGLRPEQLRAAGPAAVDADGLGVDVLPGPRPPGAGLAQDRVLLRGKLRAPLLVGLGDLGLLVRGCRHDLKVRRARHPPRGARPPAARPDRRAPWTSRCPPPRSPLASPLPGVGFPRAPPVLRAIARLVDAPAHGGAPSLGQVVPASGLAKGDVVAAARALVAAGYVEALTNYAGEIVRFTGISAEARRLAGLWPTPQGEWERLLEQLGARAANAPTDVERRRWGAMADAARALGDDDGALLMAALVGGYVPRRR